MVKKLNKIKFVRLLAAVLAVTLFLAPGSAFAANTDNADREFATHDIIVENPLLRGTSIPTTQGSLPYQGEFSNVQAGVYTNYYFTGVTSLIVEFWSTTPSNAKFTVKIWNVSGKYWVGSASNVTYKQFNNLVSTNKYAVFFYPNSGYSPASGNIEVWQG